MINELQDVEKLDKEVSTDEDYTSLKSEIDTLKSLVDSQRSLLEKQEQESKDTADKFDYLLAMKDKLIERLESRVASVDEQHNRDTNENVEIKSKEEEEKALESPSEKYKVLESEYNKLDTAKMQLECDLIAARNEIDQMKGVVEKTAQSNDLVAQKNKIQSDIDRLQSEITDAEKQCLESQQLYERLRENVVEWENSNRVIEQQILALQEQNASLGAQLVDRSNSDERFALVEKEKQDLQVKNIDLLVELDSIRADKETLLEEIHLLKNQIEIDTQEMNKEVKLIILKNFNGLKYYNCLN
jgi:chromosome segregation ATPase